MWLDSVLTLRDNRCHPLAKARQAEARLRRLVYTYKSSPGIGTQLPAGDHPGYPLVRFKALVKRQKRHRGPVPAAINRMGRATLGVFQLTPSGIVTGESGLTPARAHLNFRQARLAQRPLTRPQSQSGPEEIMQRRGSALTERLPEATLRT